MKKKGANLDFLGFKIKLSFQRLKNFFILLFMNESRSILDDLNQRIDIS